MGGDVDIDDEGKVDRGHGFQQYPSDTLLYARRLAGTDCF